MKQIAALHDDTQNSTRNISDLGALSDEIGHIVDVINDISGQSARATAEITQSIGRVQEGVSASVVDMNTSAEQAERAVESVNAS